MGAVIIAAFGDDADVGGDEIAGVPAAAGMLVIGILARVFAVPPVTPLSTIILFGIVPAAGFPDMQIFMVLQRFLLHHRYRVLLFAAGKQGIAPVNGQGQAEQAARMLA